MHVTRTVFIECTFVVGTSEFNEISRKTYTKRRRIQNVRKVFSRIVWSTVSAAVDRIRIEGTTLLYRRRRGRFDRRRKTEILAKPNYVYFFR